MIEKAVLEYGQLIINFLISCGGGYKNGVSELTQYAVFHCLGSGQYLIGFDGKGIKYFVCYWRVKPEDIEGLKERVIPYDLTTGTIMYVCECACRDKNDMMEVRRLLRLEGKGMKQVFWHNTVRDRVRHFPRQKGGEV